MSDALGTNSKTLLRPTYWRSRSPIVLSTGMFFA